MGQIVKNGPRTRLKLVWLAAVRALQTSPRKIVLVGIDAADWLAIDPQTRAGKLLTFARLRSRGAPDALNSTAHVADDLDDGCEGCACSSGRWP
jgi:hypothetical protein